MNISRYRRAKAYFLGRYVYWPLLVLFMFFSFSAWVLGSVWGMNYLAEKVQEQLICEPRHGD